MIFAAPLVLLGLAVLPGLYFLLRLTPPAARRIAFPPLALLYGLLPMEREPHRIPPWLLLLRLAAAGLTILGLAGPCLHPPPALPGKGPVLLVIDDGWAAAAAWPQVTDAARQVVGAAQQERRGVALLATARGADDAAPQIRGVMTASAAGQMLAAMQPQPWPADRGADAAALDGASETTRIYLADGITDTPGFTGFMKVLHPNRIIAPASPAPLLLPPSLDEHGNLVAQAVFASPALMVLAEQKTGGSLASATFSTAGIARIALPLAISSQISRLVLQGPAAAGSLYLLDSFAHGSLIGLASSSGAAQMPFLGALYFISRALPPGSQISTGDLASLIAEKPAIIVLADVALTPAQLQAAQDWMTSGGEIIRFAGPITAAAPDRLEPDPLLAGDRRLGGTLTWTTPQRIAPPPASSPLAGLSAGPETTVTRQILADPTRLDPTTIWAELADGTPLILGRAIGKGLLVSVLTSANADWTNLALAAIYPAMLARLTALVHGAPLQPRRELPMLYTLDGFGNLVPAAAGAPGISAGLLPQTAVSPAHPPGIYGGGGLTMALNLGGHVPAPVPAVLPQAEKLGVAQAPQNFGSFLLAAAILLLVLDLLISLAVRGLLGSRCAGC